MTQYDPQANRQKEVQQQYERLLETGRKNPALFKNQSFALQLRKAGVQAGRGDHLREDLTRVFNPLIKTNASKAQPATASTGTGAKPTTAMPKQETRPPDGDLAKASFDLLLELHKV